MSAGGEVEEGRTVSVPKVCDADQIAGILDISKRHFMRLVHVGEFPRPMLIGRSARWSASDVTGYLDKLRARREHKPRRGRDVR
jgi:excisionase family DNA binding protein